MQTFTESVIQEAEERQRKINYERALGNLATIKRSIEKETARCVPYRAQIKLLTKMLELAPDIEPNIQGKGGFLVRGVVGSNLQIALKDQERRLSETETRLKQLVKVLPVMEQRVTDAEKG